MRYALDHLKVQYGGARLRVAVDTAEGYDRLIRASLVFQQEHVEVARTTINNDYDDLACYDKLIPLDEAVATILDLLEKGWSHRLERGQEARHTEFGKRPDHWTGRRRGWPLHHMDGPRVTGWPERTFVFTVEQGSVAPRLPAVKPGLPIILDYKDLVRTWIGVTPDANHKAACTVVLPQYGGAIERATLRSNELTVKVRSALFPVADLGMRVAFSSGDKTLEPPVMSQADHFAATVSADTDDIHVFLFRKATGQVLDWANIHPMAAVQPPNFDIEVASKTVRDLIARGEDQDVEFKRTVNTARPAEFLETVVAMANQSGGTILVGVSDDGTMSGLADADKDAQRIADWGVDAIEPPVALRATPAEIDGQTLVVVTIPEGEAKPYQLRSNHGFYLRIGDKDKPMTRTQLDAIYGSRGSSPRAFPFL